MNHVRFDNPLHSELGTPFNVKKKNLGEISAEQKSDMNSFNIQLNSINDRLKFYTPQLRRKRNKNLRANEDIIADRGKSKRLR